MKKIHFSIDNLTFLKKSDILNDQYWMIEDINYNIENVMMFSNSIDITIEFVFYNNKNPNYIIIKEDNPFFKAFDKLLDFDNSILIENDCETRKYNSKIIIRRVENGILINASYLKNNMFDMLMIKNMELKERFNKFFYELDTMFKDKNEENKLQLKKAE